MIQFLGAIAVFVFVVGFGIAILPYVALVLLSLISFVSKQGNLITAALWVAFGLWGLYVLVVGQNPVYILSVIAAPIGAYVDYKHWQYLQSIASSEYD